MKKAEPIYQPIITLSFELALNTGKARCQAPAYQPQGVLTSIGSLDLEDGQGFRDWNQICEHARERSL